MNSRDQLIHAILELAQLRVQNELRALSPTEAAAVASRLAARQLQISILADLIAQTDLPSPPPMGELDDPVDHAHFTSHN